MRCGMLWLLAAGAAIGTEVHAQGRVSGRVTAAEDGRPIPGASVSVIGTNRGAVTDTAGRYRIADVPSGSRQIRARLLGFTGVTQTVEVPAGDSITVDFQLTAANAVVDTVRFLTNDTSRENWHSVAICSDGSYEVEKDLISSFPVRVHGGKWEIVQKLPINDFSRAKIDASVAEIKEEKSLVSELIP